MNRVEEPVGSLARKPVVRDVVVLSGPPTTMPASRVASLATLVCALPAHESAWLVDMHLDHACRT